MRWCCPSAQWAQVALRGQRLSARYVVKASFSSSQPYQSQCLVCAEDVSVRRVFEPAPESGPVSQVTELRGTCSLAHCVRAYAMCAGPSIRR